MYKFYDAYAFYGGSPHQLTVHHFPGANPTIDLVKHGIQRIFPFDKRVDDLQVDELPRVEFPDYVVPARKVFHFPDYSVQVVYAEKDQ